MLKRTWMMTVITGVLALTGNTVLAADQKPAQQAQEPIFGSQLMTSQERIEHRSKMRSAKTAEEREQIRKDHHDRMKERAKERGVTLPEEPPPARCGGMGPPSGGMGAGMGRNR